MTVGDRSMANRNPSKLQNIGQNIITCSYLQQPEITAIMLKRVNSTESGSFQVRNIIRYLWRHYLSEAIWLEIEIWAKSLAITVKSRIYPHGLLKPCFQEASVGLKWQGIYLNMQCLREDYLVNYLMLPSRFWRYDISLSISELTFATWFPVIDVSSVYSSSETVTCDCLEFDANKSAGDVTGRITILVYGGSAGKVHDDEYNPANPTGSRYYPQYQCIFPVFTRFGFVFFSPWFFGLWRNVKCELLKSLFIIYPSKNK